MKLRYQIPGKAYYIQVKTDKKTQSELPVEFIIKHIARFQIEGLSYYSNIRSFVLGNSYFIFPNKEIYEEVKGVFKREHLELFEDLIGIEEPVSVYDGYSIEEKVAAYNWFNGLSDDEQKHVNILVKELGLKPAMAYVLISLEYNF